MATVATSDTASTTPVMVAVRESFVNDFMVWRFDMRFKLPVLEQCRQHELRRATRPAIQQRQKSCTPRLSINYFPSLRNRRSSERTCSSIFANSSGFALAASRSPTFIESLRLLKSWPALPSSSRMTAKARLSASKRFTVTLLMFRPALPFPAFFCALCGLAARVGTTTASGAGAA